MFVKKCLKSVSKKVILKKVVLQSDFKKIYQINTELKNLFQNSVCVVS